MSRAATLGLAISIVVALLIELPLGTFQSHPHWQRVEWVPFIASPRRAVDCVLNVMLFLPLGWFDAARGTHRRALRTAALAFGVSLTGEVAQIYSHNRFPSVTDLACNVLGAVAGARLYMRFTGGHRPDLTAWMRRGSPCI